ncbi:hypothetical protein ACFQ0B_23730 [Nonomuraea thailandensis]
MLAWNGQDTEARTHAEEALALGDTRSLTTLAALTALDGDLGAASRLYAEARATAPDDDSLLITYASEADVLEAAGSTPGPSPWPARASPGPAAWAWPGRGAATWRRTWPSRSRPWAAGRRPAR